MHESEPCLIHIEKGQALPAGCPELIAAAKRAVARTGDAWKRDSMLENLDSISMGRAELFLLLCNGTPAGVLSFNVIEDDVQVYFSYVLEQYREREGQFFEAAIRAFQGLGLKVIRTNFLWPSPERYRSVARDAGFIAQERIVMQRENDLFHPEKQLPAGIEILEWSDAYMGEAGRLLFAEANPVDRQIYPQLESLEGTVEQLSKITCNFYGVFLPSQSLVAVRGGEVIGLLLATEFEEGLLLIADLAVAKSCRGKGIASALVSRLIRQSAALGKRHIELVVNAQNADAIRLYQARGFKPTVTYKQHILVFR